MASTARPENLDEIDAEVRACIVATLRGHAFRTRSTASCAVPAGRSHAYHGELARRWRMLADAVEADLFVRLDVDALAAAAAADEAFAAGCRAAIENRELTATKTTTPEEG